MFFLFSKFTFPQLRQPIIVSKLQLKFSSTVLFLECLNAHFKNVLKKFLEYCVKHRTNFVRMQIKKV